MKTLILLSSILAFSLPAFAANEVFVEEAQSQLYPQAFAASCYAAPSFQVGQCYLVRTRSLPNNRLRHGERVDYESPDIDGYIPAEASYQCRNGRLIRVSSFLRYCS